MDIARWECTSVDNLQLARFVHNYYKITPVQSINNIVLFNRLNTGRVDYKKGTHLQVAVKLR